MINRNNMWQGEGNLSRDPEIHTVGSNGAEVVHFTIAVSGAGAGSGEKDSAGFFDCKIWLTENDYVVPAEIRTAREGFKNGAWKKGDRLFVAGRLVQERWEKNGETRSRTIIQADKVQALYIRDADRAASQSGSSAPQEQVAPQRQASVPSSF